MVAEESRLVLVGEGPCWLGVATAVDEGSQGSDGAEYESEALHLVEEREDARFSGGSTSTGVSRIRWWY